MGISRAAKCCSREGGSFLKPVEHVSSLVGDDDAVGCGLREVDPSDFGRPRHILERQRIQAAISRTGHLLAELRLRRTVASAEKNL